MNKAETISAICQKTGSPKSDVERIVNAFQSVVQDELANGGDVRLLGFGTFSVHETPARKGRNPRTGETVDIPAKTVPRFKAGEALMRACN